MPEPPTSSHEGGILGLKFAWLLAGFAGGVVSLSFVRELSRWQAILSVGTSRALSSAATEYTENITVASGDLLQIYADGGGGTTYLRHFVVLCGFITMSRPIVTKSIY